MSSQEEKFNVELQSFETEHHIVWNEWKNGDGKSELTKRVLARYEERNGLWREKGTGQRADINSVITHALQAPSDRPLIRNKDLFSRYVSPFKPRSGEVMERHAAEVAKLVGQQIDKSGLVFNTKEARAKTIDVISKNFLPQDSEAGPRYHRVTMEGLISPQGWSFEELASNFRIGRFIDEDRTTLQQQMFESNLKAEAMKVSGAKDEKDYDFKATLDRLRKIDTPRVGKKIAVDGLFIKSEFEKQAILESGLNNPTLEQKRTLTAMVDQRWQSLNSVESLAPHFEEIKAAEPSTWDGI